MICFFFSPIEKSQRRKKKKNNIIFKQDQNNSVLWKKNLTNFLPGIWLGFIHDLAPKGSVTALFTSAIQSMNRLSCGNFKHQALSLAGVLKCCHLSSPAILESLLWLGLSLHNASLFPLPSQSVKTQFVSITSSWLKEGCNVNEWSWIRISHLHKDLNRKPML